MVKCWLTNRAGWCPKECRPHRNRANIAVELQAAGVADGSVTLVTIVCTNPSCCIAALMQAKVKQSLYTREQCVCGRQGTTVAPSYANAPNAPTRPRGFLISRAAVASALVVLGPVPSGAALPKSFAAATTADPTASPTMSATPVVTCRQPN
eukprot:COSAG02_NODE_14722_length_1243_cov_0.848776_1_plen_152_part_00